MTSNAAIVIARQAISGECIKWITARSTIVRVKHRLHEIVPRNTTGRIVSADAKRLDTDAVQKMLEAFDAPDLRIAIQSRARANRQGLLRQGYPSRSPFHPSILR